MRSKVRNRLKDDSVASILQTHELNDIVGDVHLPFAKFALRLDALKDELTW